MCVNNVPPVSVWGGLQPEGMDISKQIFLKGFVEGFDQFICTFTDEYIDVVELETAKLGVLRQGPLTMVNRLSHSLCGTYSLSLTHTHTHTHTQVLSHTQLFHVVLPHFHFLSPSRAHTHQHTLSVAFCRG